MINTSIEYDRAIADQRIMYIQDVITTKDGKTINLDNQKTRVYSIQDATSSDNEFEIGAAVAKKHIIHIDNSKRNYDRIELGGAEIDAKVGVQLSKTVETVRKGIFYITKAVRQGKNIQIEAYDAMVKFNKPYKNSSIGFPATIVDIISDASLECGVPFNARTIVNGNYEIKTRPEDDGITYRDMISYCAQIMGQYAKVDTEGILYFGWYDFDAFITGITDGGWFDEDAPYSSGANLDGGTFNPWNNPSNYDTGTFEHMKKAHHFSKVVSEQINNNDVVVTGIKVIADGDDTEECQYGDDGYVLEISGNPLIEKGKAEWVATYLGNKLIGCRMRPLSVNVQSNPAIEAGDVAFVTDRLLNTYQALITSTVFSFGNAQTIVCGAETNEEHEIQGYSALTKAIISARHNTKQQLSDYDKAVSTMTQLISQGFGLYFVRVEQPDGSYIPYLCDKPTIEESSYVVYMTSNGLMASVDGGTTWAIDKNGNALFNVLSVIGFYFDWAKGGTLSLGKYNNTDGVIVVRDANGTIIGRWDKEGIYAKSGKFCGTLEAATGTFAGDLSAAGGTFAGNLSAVGGTFTGNLSAPSGIIGGFNIDTASLHTGNHGSIFSTAEGSYMGKDGFSCSNGANKLANLNTGYLHIRTTAARGSNNGVYLERYGSDARAYISAESIAIEDMADELITEDYFTANKSGLYVRGSKNRIVPTENYQNRLLYCYEMSNPMFGDIGTAVIGEDGKCLIDIDNIFSETVSEKMEYYVFIQKEGEGDLYVSEKNIAYFIVKGTPGLRFSWEIKAKQFDYEYERLDTYEKDTEIEDINYEQEAVDMMIELYAEMEVTGYEKDNQLY